MGRRKKCESCDWITYSGRSKRIKEQCAECGDVFPCAADCGHFDCMEHRGAKCLSCGRKVSGTEYNLIAAGGTGCYFVHSRCVDDADIVLTVEYNEL